MLVSGIHPVVIQSTVFCVICNLLMFVSDDSGHHIVTQCVQISTAVQPRRGWLCHFGTSILYDHQHHVYMYKQSYQ